MLTRPSRKVVEGSCPNADHRVDAVQRAVPTGEQAARIGNRCSEHPELQQERQDVAHVAVRTCSAASHTRALQLRRSRAVDVRGQRPDAGLEQPGRQFQSDFQDLFSEAGSAGEQYHHGFRRFPDISGISGYVDDLVSFHTAADSVAIAGFRCRGVGSFSRRRTLDRGVDGKIP